MQQHSISKQVFVLANLSPCAGTMSIGKQKLYVRRACVLDVYKCPKTTDSVRDVNLNPLAISILKSQLKLMGKRRSKTVNVLQRDNKTLKQESLNFIFVNTKKNQPFTDAKEFTERFSKLSHCFWC